jgi:dihydrofolate reductase
MIRVSLVVAVSENNVIGKNNQLLWSLPNDMKFFKNTTWGMPVIMGRKTFESLGKPLPGRTNIVITRKSEWEAPGTVTVASLSEAIQAAEQTDAKEVFVIGGGQVYEQSMSIANRIYYTRVHTIVDGDTFFPEIDPVQFRLVSELPFTKDARHAFDYTFEIWDHI